MMLRNCKRGKKRQTATRDIKEKKKRTPDRKHSCHSELHSSPSSSLKKVQATGHRRENAMEHSATLPFIAYRGNGHVIISEISLSALLVTWSASHDVDEELARVAHGHAEGLAGRREFRWHRRQVPGWWRSRRGSRGRSVRWALAVWESAAGTVDTVLTRRGCRALTRRLLSFLTLTTAATRLCLQRTGLITTAVRAAAATP